MNRRELLQAMLAAPVVTLLPSIAQEAVYGPPIQGKFIWFGGLRETREMVGTYTYDADFAVGICEGPVTGIRRIWAEDLGRTICVYDKRPQQPDEGFWEYAHRVGYTEEIERRLTVYLGSETQAPSPLIGPDAPAFQGLHYVTLQEFPVEPFGNRVPTLWFETA